MFKRLIWALALLCSYFVSAQQNNEFRQVKERFKHHKAMVTDAFKKEYDSENQGPKRAAMLKEFAGFMSKMDSVENSMYLVSLIKVKNSEDLSKLKNTPSDTAETHKGPEKEPQYPGGTAALRSEIADLFYTGTITEKEKSYKSLVSFIVENDGSVSSVEASGSSVQFNRQAVIAVYLLTNRFTPATLNGEPVRYRYSLPISLSLP